MGRFNLFDSATQFGLLQTLTDPDADVRRAGADGLYRKGIREAAEATREIVS